MSKISAVNLQFNCPKDGWPISYDPSASEVKCEVCGTSYYPSQPYISFLRFKIGEDKWQEVPVESDLVIGRNRRDNVTLKDPLRSSIKSSLPIKTPYVSGTHLKIKTRKSLEIIPKDDTQYLVERTICEVEDDNSMNGTCVNGAFLDGALELKHGDKIILAPDCRRQVEIEYIEKRV